MWKYPRVLLLAGPRLLWDYTFYLWRYARHPERTPIERRYAVARRLVLFILKRFRVDWKVEGIDYIRELEAKNQCYLLTPNHMSDLDPLAILCLSEKPISFVAKKETRKMPFIGTAVKALDGYFSKWINLQEEGLKEIRESFSEVPVFTLMLLNKELATESILLEAAKQIFGATDPAAVLFKDTIFEVKKEEDGYDFILNIPFADKADMDMGQKGSELMIQIKNEKRCFTLPDILRNKTVQNARYEEGQLHIKFA